MVKLINHNLHGRLKSVRWHTKRLASFVGVHANPHPHPYQYVTALTELKMLCIVAIVRGGNIPLVLVNSRLAKNRRGNIVIIHQIQVVAIKLVHQSHALGYSHRLQNPWSQTIVLVALTIT
jgi:hypothetical protein